MVTTEFYPRYDAGMCLTKCPFLDENIGSHNCLKCPHNHDTIRRDDFTMERHLAEIVFCKHPQAQEA